MTKKKTKKVDIKYLDGFFHSKVNILVMLVSMIGCFSVLFFFLGLKPINIFPHNNDFSFDSNTDLENEGKSVIHNFSVTDSLITLDYELRKGFVKPYVNISIELKPGKLLKSKHYNQVVLDLAAFDTENIGLSINAPLLVPELDHINTDVFFNNIIFDLAANRKQYTIDFKELKVPDYWRIDNNISANTTIAPDLSQISQIGIGTSDLVKLNKKRSLKIHSIYIVRDNTNLIVLLIIVEFLVFLVLAILYYFKAYKHHKKKHVVISYKPIEIKKDKDSKTPIDCIEYINSNFNDVEISLKETAIHLGINKRIITNTIQEKYGCNFKTYINRLRINESKRLLKETDLNMGEVAFKVGFNTQSHFNRVFKSIENINPTDFKQSKS